MFLEKIKLNIKHKIWPHLKNHWFPYILVLACYSVFHLSSGVGTEIHSKKCMVDADKPNCYIFYGIAQNSIGKGGTKNRLEVRYLIEGFPKRPHHVFVEVIDSDGKLDFLYSENHSSSHKAHYCKDGCLREYKSFYKIPGRLKPGKYELLVTFKFKYLLGTKDLVSNRIKFTIK